MCRKFIKFISVAVLAVSCCGAQINILHASAGSVYTLPGYADKDLLLYSTVIVNDSGKVSSGIAIGPDTIITAAHCVAQRVLLGGDTKVVIPKDAPRVDVFGHMSYLFPTVESKKSDGGSSYSPDFRDSGDAEVYNVVEIILNPLTRIEKIDELTVMSIPLEEFPSHIDEALASGREADLKRNANGVSAEYGELLEGVVKVKNSIVYGPDVAILKLDRPHNLPVLPIADSMEKSVVHILGVSGRRYLNNRESGLFAGAPTLVSGVPKYIISPQIYAQSFKLLPAYDGEGFLWESRVPLLKFEKGGFCLSDQVYPDPDSQEGFGLIAINDSGSAGIVFQDGMPKLAGIVSQGNVPYTFLKANEILKAFNAFNHDYAQLIDMPDMVIQLCASQSGLPVGGIKGLAVLTKKYQDAVAAYSVADYKNMWYIKQNLSDVISLRAWIAENTQS